MERSSGGHSGVMPISSGLFGTPAGAGEADLHSMEQHFAQPDRLRDVAGTARAGVQVPHTLPRRWRARKQRRLTALAQQSSRMGGYVFWKKSLYGVTVPYTANVARFDLARQWDIPLRTAAVWRRFKQPTYWRFAYNHVGGITFDYGLAPPRHELPIAIRAASIPRRQQTVFATRRRGCAISVHLTRTALRPRRTWPEDNRITQASQAQPPRPGAGSGRYSRRTTAYVPGASKATYYARSEIRLLAYFSTTGSSDSGLYGTDSRRTH